MMRLRDLEGSLIKRELRDGGDYRVPVEAIRDADGVRFLCPKCFSKNGGPVGTHLVICWFVGRVPIDLDPKPGRWHPFGHSIEDLTFIGPGNVSVAIQGACCWHGFVRDGEATLT
jgi:hypothetical protein